MKKSQQVSDECQLPGHCGQYLPNIEQIQLGELTWRVQRSFPLVSGRTSDPLQTPGIGIPSCAWSVSFYWNKDRSQPNRVEATSKHVQCVCICVSIHLCCVKLTGALVAFFQELFYCVFWLLAFRLINEHRRDRSSDVVYGQRRSCNITREREIRILQANSVWAISA